MRLGFIFILVTLMLSSMTVNADCSNYRMKSERLACYDQNRYSRCSNIRSDIDRLRCYDKSENERGSEWRRKQSENAIEGTKRTSISVSSSYELEDRSRTAKLYIACEDGQTSLYIDWDNYLGFRQKYSNVTTKLDSQPRDSSSWFIDHNKRRTYHPQPIEMIKRMLRRNTYYAQTTFYRKGTGIVEFNIEGLRSAVDPIRRACHW